MGTTGGHGAEGGAGEGMSWAALKLLHTGEDGSLLQPLARRSREDVAPWLAEGRDGVQRRGVAPWEDGSRAPCALGKKAPCSAWGKKPGREESGG
jgi:hypothetical protein